MKQVTVATAAYPLDWHEDWASYEAKVRAWVQAGALKRADLLVFPEYGAMEIASLGGPEVAGDLDRSVAEVARHVGAMERLFEGLAIEFGLYILAPSGPVIEGMARRNRATLFGPAGRIGHQDKAIMTRFERDDWRIDGGSDGLRLFDTGFGRLAILICYDSEFPLLARAVCEAGAVLLLVPSCTDTRAGYHRVRVGAQARALENQCVTVQAVVVGAAAWCPAVAENHGAAALYAPPDVNWCETGVIAEGAYDAPGWVVAKVDLEKVEIARTDGEVLTFRHWGEQAMQTAHVGLEPESPRKA
ncbi:carbon-nitrogen hydrolase family protein [Rhodobacter maris]|uniref:Predicted amidohydrolase n=1 Tax=Rhodobacter maris TaxID=446682 RepID=A0A285S4Y9_9RHOB|nr:carbon-nitrogen hydrolase family protein [Rhodobacter maris]SOC02038.1 predicted amidohydrolase [Rhodobacter maris]